MHPILNDMFEDALGLAILTTFLAGACVDAPHEASVPTSVSPPPVAVDRPFESSPARPCKTSQSEAIVRRSEDVLELSPCWFDWLLTHDEWLRSLYPVPHEDDHGTLVGVKIYGIRSSSLLSVLGFRNGDLVSSINRSPTVAFEATRSALSVMIREERAIVELRRSDKLVRKTFLRKPATPREAGQ